MPPEPTQAKLKRRSSRRELPEESKYDATQIREVELKRNRGEISCAECRRLKIKCDKQVPCQSCQRRGCQVLCPNGSLATGQGTRFVLAATEHLHKKIAKYSARIRQLEDALASLQSEHSEEPHPLLSSTLKTTLNTGHEDDVRSSTSESKILTTGLESIDAFGTLSISDHGISRFFGPTGGSESLLLVNSASSQEQTSSNPASPQSPPTFTSSTAAPTPLFSQSFPFTPIGATPDMQNSIRTNLPIYERAMVLCNLYFEQIAWIFRGVTRQQIYEDMLPAIYNDSQVSSSSEDYSSPHDLALLFIVFAMGALFETSPESHESDGGQSEMHALKAAAELAGHYHQIARAALCLQPVLEKPSLVTIQTLHLLSIYNAMSGSDLSGESSMEMTWSLITLAAHLSQTIGLHRDAERWGLEPKIVHRRRIVFYDLFVADAWTSLSTGRPPSFSKAYIDCTLPTYESTSDEKEANLQTYEAWSFRFASECVAEVASKTLTAEAPSYAVIMELDRKVREFPSPEPAAGSTGSTQDSSTASIQKAVRDHVKETILLYIHRSFFAQALIENPENPLNSTYAPSFLAAYRSSTIILTSIKEQYERSPIITSRHWTMLTFAFSAAIVFGAVATRAPRSSLASSAMAELEQACILFSKASRLSNRAKKALPILNNFRAKAAKALVETKNNAMVDDSMTRHPRQDGHADELSIFAGHTRFVTGMRATSSSPSHSSPSTSVGNAQPISVSDFAREPVPSTHLHPRQMQMHAPLATGAPAMQPASVTPTENWMYEQANQDHYMSPINTRSYQAHIAPPQSSMRLYHGEQEDVPRISSTTRQARELDYSQAREGPSYGQYILPPPQPHHGQYAQYNYSPPTQNHGYYANEEHAIPSGYSTGQPLNPGLASLGIAARDSRLDERWSSFMQDSGILEDTYPQNR